MSANAGGAPTIESVNARVGVLEAGQVDILNGLKEIRTDLKGAGRTQWPVIFAGLGFMMGVLAFIGNSWKAPIDGQLARMDTDVRQLQAAVVPRAEHADKQRQTEEMMAAMRERVTRDMTTERNLTVEGERRLAERIERLEARVLFNTGKRSELTRTLTQ